MTVHQGVVDTYSLSIKSPNASSNYKCVISLRGKFGTALLYFVPPEGTLGTNRKRTRAKFFEIYYWMYSWLQFVDMLRNEKPVYFTYDDTAKSAQIKTLSREPVGETES